MIRYRVALIGVLLGLSCVGSGALAQDKPLTENLIDLAHHKDYKSAFFGMFKGEYSAPMWVDKFDANSSPAVQTTIDGKEYVTASMCKASDCNSDKLFAIFTGDHKKAWGLEVTVPPAGPDALKNPKKYAAFRYYGGPDLAMRKLLMQQLEKDPYWH